MGMKSSVIKALGGSAPSLIWKNGTAGNPFVDGDTINAVHNSIIMIQVPEFDRVVINLPAITPDSAGRTIQVRNMLDQKMGPFPGNVVLKAGLDDTVEFISPLDDFVAPVYPQREFDVTPSGDSCWVDMSGHFSLESDGFSRWNFILPLGGASYLVQGI